jgi:drug/metabolite transporter (DMT)-like permease
MQQTLSTRAWAELILLALIWGGSFLSIRIALDEIGPLTVVAHRTFWAMAILWIWVALR